MPETTPLPRLKPEREADLRKRLADGTWPAKSVYELLAEIDALRAQLAQVRAQQDECVRVLSSLRNAVVGMLGIGVSDSVGHTNAKVLEHWCHEADAVIALATGTPPASQGE